MTISFVDESCDLGLRWKISVDVDFGNTFGYNGVFGIVVVVLVVLFCC